MAGNLKKEYTVEKSKIQKLLTGARMIEICYGEIFNLFFEQNFGGRNISLVFLIEAPCWFGEKEEWMAKVEAFENGEEKAESEHCLLASELTRLRYWNLIDVEKVDFLEDHMEIVFPERNVLSVSYDADESDYAWYLEEVSSKKESERMGIGCDGRELFQNNIESIIKTASRSVFPG